MNQEEINKDITYLARTNFRGTDRMFGIKRKDRRQHMYVLGKSGTGKSTLLENMILQNVLNGEGLCVIDPHGELVEKIVASIPEERKEDVIYFNPSDTDFCIGFNVLQLDDPKYKHLVASGLMGIFTKIWANTWSSRMEYIMNNCILALLDTPGSTLMGIPRLLVDKDYRQYIIANLKDPVVKAFWIHEYEAWRDQFRNEAIQPIQNKVGQFLSSGIVRNIVGQAKSTINIFDIMNSQKIFLVNLSKGRIGEDNSALLGGMLITKLQLAAMERVRITEAERKDFYLYVDEFQNFVTDSFASILSEARKYRLCLVLAHQYIAQLETSNGSAVKDAVFGNVGTMIVFRVGAEDGSALEGEFEPEFETEDFVNLPNYHVYMKLMVDGVTSRPFSARTLPPIEIHESETVKQAIIDTCRKIYTISRDQVERDIDRWSSSVPGAQNSDGEEAAPGKFKAECWGDKKQIYVPFEPIEGKPIYCKDCMIKIKNGELTPAPGFRLPRDKNARPVVSYDALAHLGIEFTTEPKKPERSFDRSNDTRPFVKPAPQAYPNNTFNKKDSRDIRENNDFIKNTFEPRKEPPRRVNSNNQGFSSQPRAIRKDEPVKSLGDIIKNTIKPLIGIKPKEDISLEKVEHAVQPTLSLKELTKEKAVTKPILAEDVKGIKKESSDQLKNIIAQVMSTSKKQPKDESVLSETTKEIPNLIEKVDQVIEKTEDTLSFDIISNSSSANSYEDIPKDIEPISINQDINKNNNVVNISNVEIPMIKQNAQADDAIETPILKKNDKVNQVPEDAFNKIFQ